MFYNLTPRRKNGKQFIPDLYGAELGKKKEQFPS